MGGDVSQAVRLFFVPLLLQCWMAAVPDNVAFPPAPIFGQPAAADIASTADIASAASAASIPASIPAGIPAGDFTGSQSYGKPKNWGRIVTYAVVIVLLAVGIYFLMTPRSLTARLQSAGWFVYLSPTCPHCKRQLEVLGGSYALSTQCGSPNPNPSAPVPCSEIKAFPTWYNTKSGKSVKGMRTVSQLEEMLSQSV